MVKLVLDDSPQGLLEKCQILMLRFQVYKLILCRYVDLISTEQFDNAMYWNYTLGSIPGAKF
jgi:hypothetical protein